LTICLQGATTLDEYRKYIESDPALARRFQSVLVTEPTVDSTISILRGLKERYEVHHGITFQDAALVAAARLSHRYITNRFLPDKAIDLMDEAASRLRLQQESKPESIENIERKIMTIKIELEALRKDTDPTSVDRRQALNRQLEKRQARMDELLAKWKQEKSELDKVKEAKMKLENAKHELITMQRDGKFERASELKFGIIPQLEKQVCCTQLRNRTRHLALVDNASACIL
jgi:ATP-dependent Clp protease ATP-binding subunit ClpB